MKKIMLLAAVLFILAGCGKKEDGAKERPEKIRIPEISWISNIEQAVETAGKENRSVLVNFTGSDWCSWCFRLRDEVFTMPAFAEYSSSALVLVEIDFPKKKVLPDDVKRYNEGVLRKYGVRGFPTVILLNGKGEEIARTGYVQGGAAVYVEHLKNLVK